MGPATQGGNEKFTLNAMPTIWLSSVKILVAPPSSIRSSATCSVFWYGVQPRSCTTHADAGTKKEKPGAVQRRMTPAWFSGQKKPPISRGRPFAPNEFEE